MRLTPAELPRFENWTQDDRWPGSWIAVRSPGRESFVAAYRLVFSLGAAAKVRIHLSADQRYRFFVDGKREGEGPERGDLFNWYYQTHELELAAGRHCIVAVAWTLSREEGIMPGAQITSGHGFVLTADAPHTELLSTGIAPWESKLVEGISFRASGLTGAGILSGATEVIDGNAYPPDLADGGGQDWLPAGARNPALLKLSDSNWGIADAPLLRPGQLPVLAEKIIPCRQIRHVAGLPEGDSLLKVDRTENLYKEAHELQINWDKGKPYHIGAGRKLWFLIDLDEYYCGYTNLKITGGKGACIDVLWAESLLEEPENLRSKGHRDMIEGKYFHGCGDTFLGRGGPEPTSFTPFWWNCGRYLAIIVKTGEEALDLHPLTIRETRYPFEMAATLELENQDFERSRRIMWRSAQMCAHETYMDCPYFEQMNYAGDTRVQALISYVASGDHRLARRCIKLFADSLLPNGLTSARYPSVNPQIIPQFSLYWAAMLYDYALWGKDTAWLRQFLPSMRSVIDTFLAHVDASGLLQRPEGWDWVDWTWRVKGKEAGLFESTNQLLLVHVLGLMSELEGWIGRPDNVRYFNEERLRIWDRAVELFWDEQRGLFSYDLDHRRFGEHPQCFAVLGGLLDAEREASVKRFLVEDERLERATYFFRHYLFEAYSRLGLEKEIVKGFAPWGMMARMGLRTTLERNDQDRSDCHAWSAHPLYHAASSIAGIRPAGPGFSEVRIRPAIMAVSSAKVVIPHHRGKISVSWRREESMVWLSCAVPDKLPGQIKLPDGSLENLGGNRHWTIDLGVPNGLDESANLTK